MSDLQIERRSALQKVPVECRTCGVSEAYYSNLSVDKFKARHSGHDVVSGSPRVDNAWMRRAHQDVTTVNEVVPTPAEPEAVAAPKEGEPSAGEAGVKVAKVLVDVLNFPSLGGPMVRVRGFDVLLEEAFTVTLLLEQGAKIREMLEKGNYLDRDASGQLYFWEPDVVEYVDDAKAKIETLGQAPAEAATTEPVPDSVESEVVDQTAVASTVDVVMETVPEVEVSPVEVEVAPLELEVEAEPLPEPSPPSPAMEEEVEVPAPPQPPQMTPAPPVEPVEVAASTPSEPVPPKPKAKTAVDAPREDAAPPSKEEEEGYLLVSKSWYIQGGTGNRKEAVRISKVLKGFRWNVEPAYTIGVMLDDMLSIETSRSQVSGTLIRRIEGAGYRLTAVVTDKGKPVAWFKKDGSEKAALPGEPAADHAGRSGPYDSEMDLEPDVTG
jgi:hypothetical protein